MCDSCISGSVATRNILQRSKKRFRIHKHEYYMNIALAVLARSTCIRRCYGAVVVNKDDDIVATGYNGSPRGIVNCCDINKCKRNELNIPPGHRYELCLALHAEENAIIRAGRDACIGATIYIAGVDPTTGDLLSEVKPCIHCEKVIFNSGITCVVGRHNGVNAEFKYSKQGVIIKEL